MSCVGVDPEMMWQTWSSLSCCKYDPLYFREVFAVCASVKIAARIVALYH